MLDDALGPDDVTADRADDAVVLKLLALEVEDGIDDMLQRLRPSDRSLAVFQITGAEANLPFIEEPDTPS